MARADGSTSLGSPSRFAYATSFRPASLLACRALHPPALTAGGPKNGVRSNLERVAQLPENGADLVLLGLTFMLNNERLCVPPRRCELGLSSTCLRRRVGPRRQGRGHGVE